MTPMERFVNILQTPILANPLGLWLGVLVAAFLVVTTLAIVRRVAIKRLEPKATGSPDSPVALVARLVLSLSTLCVVAVVVAAMAQVLVLPSVVIRLLQIMMVVALAAQAIIWAGQVVAFLVAVFLAKRHTGNDATDRSLATTMSAVKFLASVIVYSAIVLLALDNLNVDVTAMIAGLGVGGIAVALAVQSILGDLFGSLSIVLDKPFIVGDFIVVGQHMGTVERIGIKTTRLRALSGEQLVFGNSDLLSSRVQNFKRMTERRIVFTFGLTYSSDAAQLRDVPPFVKGAVQSIPGTRFDRCHFKQFGPSSLDFEVVYFVLSPDFNVYMDIQQQVNFAILEEVRRRGLSFAFPTQTVFNVDDDRTVQTLQGIAAGMQATGPRMVPVGGRAQAGGPDTIRPDRRAPDTTDLDMSGDDGASGAEGAQG